MQTQYPTLEREIEKEKQEGFEVTSKGRAALIAIETGLIQPDTENGGYDIDPFMKFWDRVEVEIIFSKIVPELMAIERSLNRRNRWKIPLAISGAAIALGLLALLIAGMMR